MARLSSRERGYTHRWDKARATYLAHHPLCVMCIKTGHVTAAQIVDHINPHRGDQTLFWDKTNWQSLCPPHHNSRKQREEKAGHALGSTADGRPVDPSHPWNR